MEGLVKKMNIKSAIITGANGFVGSWLANRLAKEDIKVYAIVRNKESNVSRITKSDNIEIVYRDMDNIDLLKQQITKGIDIFYHFAWDGTAGELRGDYNLQLDNVRNTCRAVHVAYELGCKKFVMASSIMEKECADIMEAGLSAGRSYIYATAKMTANYMAKIEANNLDMEYNAGIISNIYGVGEISPRLINSSIKKLLAGERASFSSGEQMYDFIYVEDAVEAFYQLSIKGVNNKSYYIGSRHPKKLKEFLLEMRDVVAPKAELGLGDFVFNGISLDYSEIDVDSLYIDTGFEPQYTFAEGIYETKNWIEKHLKERNNE